MKKDFSKWFSIKKETNEIESKTFFNEREVWWCKLGANVEFEIDGRGDTYERPVVIVKKFNLDTCIIIPLTAKPKKGKYYFPMGLVNGRDAIAVLSQLRLIDRKRLSEKIEMIPKEIFKDLLNMIVKINFTYDDAL